MQPDKVMQLDKATQPDKAANVQNGLPEVKNMTFYMIAKSLSLLILNKLLQLQSLRR